MELKPDKDGDLYNLLPYIFYAGGDSIRLDGGFTSDELIQLSEYMKSVQERERNELQAPQRPE